MHGMSARWGGHPEWNSGNSQLFNDSEAALVSCNHMEGFKQCDGSQQFEVESATNCRCLVKYGDQYPYYYRGNQDTAPMLTIMAIGVLTYGETV
ncbi:MAG: hypothetical protein ACQEXQ_01390 [Bacillota bacterium]